MEKTTVLCEECGYQHELSDKDHTPETCFGCGSYNLQILVNGTLYRLTEADLEFSVQEIKDRKSEVDIKKYATAIKEIGDVALKHAKDNPVQAQLLLDLTCTIFQRASGITKCPQRVEREAINGIN